MLQERKHKDIESKNVSCSGRVASNDKTFPLSLQIDWAHEEDTIIQGTFEESLSLHLIDGFNTELCRGHSYEPPDRRRLDMMEPIQLMLSDEPPNSSWNATKKIPKLFSVPITRTFTCASTHT